MRYKAAAAVVLAAVFLAGAAATLGVLHLVEHKRGPTPVVARPPFPGDRGPRAPGPGDPRSLFGEPRRYMEVAHSRVTDRMARALQLTDEQREAIDEAMERSRAAAQEAMAEVLPRLQGRLDSLQAEIDRILTDEQRETFREFRSRDRDRFRREGRRWFRRPGRSGWP